MRRERVTLNGLRQSASQRPADAAASVALASALFVRRDYAEAIDVLREALRHSPAHAGCYFTLGKILRKQMDWPGALSAVRQGLACSDVTDEALTLGRLYEKVGDREAALVVYTAISRAAPRRWDAYEELFRLLLNGRTAAEALDAADGLVPDLGRDLVVTRSVARALERLGRYPEALDCCHAMPADAREEPSVAYGMARVHTALGDADLAQRLLEDALRRHPSNRLVVRAHLEVLMYKGDLAALRARFRDAEVQRIVRAVAAGLLLDPERAPIVDLSQPIDGQVILLQCGGGYGDVLQDCRFASFLTRRGARVVVQCPPPLKDLLGGLPDVDDVVAPYDECREVDAQCAPAHAVYGLDWSWRWEELHDMAPYLGAGAGRRARWASRFDRTHVNVGLVWRSGDLDVENPYTYRSMPLQACEPLARLPDVRVYGLQVGPGVAELGSAAERWLAGNFEEETRDFRDAAAAITALDMLVSVDSALAHLAGALRKPCCLLLPHLPDGRWMPAGPLMTDRRCVWYPSVRLYRQPRPGDWGPAIEQVARDLRSRPAQRASHDHVDDGLRGRGVSLGP